MSKSNQLTNQILQFFYEQKSYCWRQNTGGIFDLRKRTYRTGAKKGVSDILCCLPPMGRFLAIEVKIPPDKLSPEQEGFLLNVKHSGGSTFVAKDFASFVHWFKSLSTK